MNPFFIILVIIGAFLLWLILGFLYKPTGEIFFKLISNLKNTFNDTQANNLEYHLNDKETELVIAVLKRIEEYLKICYWNANQEELSSPFINSGTNYKNDTFSVNAYNWGDNSEPNFCYKGLKVWWYKNLERDTYIKTNKKITVDFLIDMLRDCNKSIKKDFSSKL